MKKWKMISLGMIIAFILIGCVTVDNSYLRSKQTPKTNDTQSIALQDETWNSYKLYNISKIRLEIDTLTTHGHAIEASNDMMYKVAVALEKDGKTKEAIIILNRLLRVIENGGDTLEITQFHDILTTKAYAYADSQQHEKAIEIYEQMIKLLLDTEHINAINNILLYNKSSDDMILWMVAGKYQDKFVSETVIRNWVDARKDLILAVEIYEKLKLPEKIGESFYAYYNNAKVLNESTEMDWCKKELDRRYK